MPSLKLLQVADCNDNDSASLLESCSCCECRECTVACQQLQHFTNPSALHPAFLGKWVSHHSEGMIIEPTTVHLCGDTPCLIERLALRLHHPPQMGQFSVHPAAKPQPGWLEYCVCSAGHVAAVDVFSFAFPIADAVLVAAVWPLGTQVLEVNYSNGNTHHWVKA